MRTFPLGLPFRALSIATALFLSACAQTGPVEFSASANPPASDKDGPADFSGMDNSMNACKTQSRQAGADRCTQVRAYESCMKSKGYITVLGPENPPNCGQPDWEQDVRKWLR
ncbi:MULTISPECIES: hypothetical protein [unclassified Caballeronia]|uniref:hypothetical protein n=1 Tax=unclassified Caballeronia TaxID=2646786 RepID=UPI002863C408|nr:MULTISPECIES: hypothetical protein [unclassified Caballeronia]MDR5771537.1 hypothetical protein [Caballeronia sp. LZ002]MDR5846973.1 hypothetical protein [Caballeronia sp. LZ003]